MSFFFSSEQSSSSRRTSKPVAKLRQARGMRQDQTMMYQQETEQILRTERFLQQVEKATTNVKEYADAVANGADGETQEMANLVATMSMRAMNMSTKSLRKEGLTDALKLGKKKLSAFYRSNAAAYDGYEEAADLFEQFTAYLRNAMDGKPVPQLAVAIPDEPENEEEGNAMLNETVGHLLSGYHGVDEADKRTMQNLEEVQRKHELMKRESADEKDGQGGVRLDASKFNRHVSGEKVMFTSGYMKSVEEKSKAQVRVDSSYGDVDVDTLGVCRGSSPRRPFANLETDADGDYVMSENRRLSGGHRTFRY